MRKIWSMIIILSLLLSLCACTDTPIETGSNTTATAGDTQNTPETDDTSYMDIERIEARAYQSKYYSFRGDDTLLSLTYPIEWSLEAYDGGYDIIRDGKGVGRLVGGSAVESGAVLESDSHTVNSVNVDKFIERDGAEYRYRYVYSYSTDQGTRQVTLTADCAELDTTSEQRLFESVYAPKKSWSDTTGILSDYLGDESSILILGNSFIGTSDIGSVLSEMFAKNGKTCQVRAISRGYARVSTYTGDNALMDSIRGGQYDAIFLCGLYAMDEVPNIELMREACEQGFAELIIFPAHNENVNAVAAAQAEYDDVIWLNWKAEIIGLIEGGVDMWKLCINDSHKHSTPLAGYVGAHMIYRAIYDEMPAEPMRYAIDQNYVDSILGDYAYVGDARTVDENKITYFD